MAPSTTTALVITPDAFLQHWQGHRRVTRRYIEVFPEEAMFKYSIGGMRTFAQFVMEFVGMGVPTLRGMTTGAWDSEKLPTPDTKSEMLNLWDKNTEEINRLFAQIPPDGFQKSHNAFGQWEMKGHELLLYIIDNEIHHRAQGSVYLRSVGIEPPAFYDRS
ncbi:MAG: DinB family protein [Gemmatimonadota bacterium]